MPSCGASAAGFNQETSAPSSLQLLICSHPRSTAAGGIDQVNLNVKRQLPSFFAVTWMHMEDCSPRMTGKRSSICSPGRSRFATATCTKMRSKSFSSCRYTSSAAPCRSANITQLLERYRCFG